VTIVVNTTRDVSTDDGRCSLREAVNSSNTDIASGTKRGECGQGDLQDIIQLKRKTTYALTVNGPDDEDDNQDGDLDVIAVTPGSVTIRGGRGTKIVQRDRDQRVIDMGGSATNLTLESVTLTGGRAIAPLAGSGAPSLNGGGIYGVGTLTLKRAAVVGNAAGDALMSASAIPGGSGGGIYHAGNGTITIERSTIANNRAGRGMPAIGGPGPGAQPGGSGGGINNTAAGRLVITSSRITGNRAGDGGNGAEGVGPFSPKNGGNGGLGGGIATAANLLFIEVTTISGNRAGNGGPGGNGGTDIAGAGQNGASGGIGGRGGGISTSLSSETTLSYSTVSGNQAGLGGVGGTGGAGSPPGSTGPAGNGGAGGGLQFDGDAQLRNVTVSGNRATSGGGVSSTDDVLLNNVTIARNIAVSAGGGYHRGPTGSVEMHNSIVADNTGGLTNDCFATFVANSNNLIEDDYGCSGLGGTDITGVDPKLATLASNGWRTKTHALRPGSPAIDEGYPGPPSGSEPACEPLDQRGRTRTVCDVGSFER
jgi:CSLREA domain-containing protein